MRTKIFKPNTFSGAIIFFVAVLAILVFDGEVFAESFVTGGRPLSFYGMNGGSLIHGASAIPLEQARASAGQYYDGIYSGNPNYYLATNLASDEFLYDKNSAMIISSISSGISPNQYFFPGTSYTGRSDSAVSYSAISPYSNGSRLKNNAGQNAENGNYPSGGIYYSGSSVQSSLYGYYQLPTLSLINPIPEIKKEIAIRKAEQLAQKEAKVALAKKQAEEKNNASMAAGAGYIDYMKSRISDFVKGAID